MVKIKDSKFILLGLLILGNFVLGYKLSSYKTVLSQKKLDLNLARRDLSLLNKLAEDNLQSQNKLNKALSTLPQTYSDVALLTYKIENIASDLGLTTEVSFDKTAVDKADIKTVAAKIVTQGSFQNYTKFLNALSELPYNTDVVSSNVISDSGTLTHTTVINIYLRI